jgi:alpha-tubulin suppressor-like RCC1 family protein
MREVRRSWAALLTVGMLIAGASIAPSASASSFGLFAWGLNEKGQLGDGTTETSESPIAVSGLEGVTSVAGGEGHGLALMAGGTVMAWGSNEDGQLGDGHARRQRRAGAGHRIGRHHGGRRRRLLQLCAAERRNRHGVG